MINVALNRNKGYKWYNGDGIHVKGFVFDKDGKCYQNEGLIPYFQNVSNEKELHQLLLQTNGLFAVVLSTEKHLIAAVDRVRSLPLFYSIKNEVITDDVNTIGYESNGFSILEEDEFLHCGYVTGSDTLSPFIKQIQAGEIFFYNNELGALSIKQYFNFKHANFSNLNDEQLIEKYDAVLDEVFERYIKLLNGRTAVVPLSAGHDSRIIVQKLHQLNYKNVICFSYGKKNNWESNISKKVSEFYGYKWLFVEYLNFDLFDLYQKEINEYMKYSTNISSSAHTQDLLALIKLKNHLPKDSVFIPGHTGDFITGGHIPPSFGSQNSKPQIIHQILLKHFGLMGSIDFIKQKVSRKISSQLRITNKEVLNLEEASSIYEEWVWRERQVKYIVNSVRVYDYYDFEWVLPLWDNNVIRFWSTIPAEQRRERRLYFKYANKKYNSKIPVNPPVNFFKRIYNKLLDPWYSRFLKNQNVFSLYVTRVKDIFPLFKREYLDSNTRLIKFPRTGLNAIKMLYSMKNK